MSNTDHLAKAKDYADIAESSDSKREAYFKCADEIAAAKAERPELTQAQIGDALDRSRSWVAKVMQARERFLKTGVFAMDHVSGSNQRDEVTTKTLAKADERQVKEIVAALPQKAIEQLVDTATERLVENARATRAEHKTEPTVRELMGGERFDPAENWADNLILRVHTNARALDKLIARAGGLILGSLSREEAFEYLQEAERQIAEARAAVQEQIRDEVQV